MKETVIKVTFESTNDMKHIVNVKIVILTGKKSKQHCTLSNVESYVHTPVSTLRLHPIKPWNF